MFNPIELIKNIYNLFYNLFVERDWSDSINVSHGTNCFCRCGYAAGQIKFEQMVCPVCGNKDVYLIEWKSGNSVRVRKKIINDYSDYNEAKRLEEKGE